MSGVYSKTVEKVKRPKVVTDEPGILSVDDMVRLFRMNQKIDPEICGLLALGAFAGMRTSAIAKMDYEEIDFAQRGILIPASKTKKRRRQWIEGLPWSMRFLSFLFLGSNLWFFEKVVLKPQVLLLLA